MPTKDPRLVSALLNQARNTSNYSFVQSLVAANVSIVYAEPGQNSSYDKLNSTIKISTEPGTNQLVDFFHEFGHNQFKDYRYDELLSAQATQNLPLTIQVDMEREGLAIGFEYLSGAGNSVGYMNYSKVGSIYSQVAGSLSSMSNVTYEQFMTMFSKALAAEMKKDPRMQAYFLKRAQNWLANHQLTSQAAPTGNSGDLDPDYPFFSQSTVTFAPPPIPKKVTITVSDPVPVQDPAAPPPPSNTDPDPEPNPDPEPDPGDIGDGDGGGGGGGCVAVTSWLPNGTIAGDVKIGSVLKLAHESTLAPATGEVSYSQRKTQPGYRIITQSGVSLVCSSTAPIPTRNGLVLAPDLAGQHVPTRRDNADGSFSTAWELVEAVQSIGPVEVQHITVGDRCFWAGEQQGAYILHHNMKAEDPGDGGDDPDPWDGDWRGAGNALAPVQPTNKSISTPPSPMNSRLDQLGASLTTAMAGFKEASSVLDGDSTSTHHFTQSPQILPPQ